MMSRAAVSALRGKDGRDARLSAIGCADPIPFLSGCDCAEKPSRSGLRPTWLIDDEAICRTQEVATGFLLLQEMLKGCSRFRE